MRMSSRLLLVLGFSAAVLLPGSAPAFECGEPVSLLGDADGDGIVDPLDKCINVPDVLQMDADGDGCGNCCDGDYDNSGFSGISDFVTFRICLVLDNQNPDVYDVGDPGGPFNDPFCTESDMNSSGLINIGDFAVFAKEFSGAPGPSGVGTGGPACP